MAILSHNMPKASGINRKGEVVGTSSLEGQQVNHAFLYFKGQMKDLNSLVPPNCLGGFSFLGEATAINDKGQITGTGRLRGFQHALLATPIEQKVSP